MTTATVPSVSTGSGSTTLVARLTRFIVLWTIAGALLDELSDLRTGRSRR